MATADVTVFGAGIFGLGCAWACARRGARVRLIERDRIGAGSSGGLVGALAPHAPEQWNPKKQFQLESLLMAEGFWAEVAAAGGVDPGYAREGRILPAPDPARAEALAAGAARHWGGAADWRRVPAADHAGWIAADGDLSFDTLTARLSPRAAGRALAAAIEVRGGAIVLGEAPAQGAVIWATGAPGLADLSASLGRDVGTGIKGQSAAFACDARGRPQIYADGLHIVPHADGTVAVGSTTERVFSDGESTDDQLDALIGRARALCPALRSAPVVERWAGVRPRARTRAPMLGAWPGRPGHYVANGGFKIGFGMAPKVAEVMADLVLEGRDGIPEGFRVEDSL